MSLNDLFSLCNTAVLPGWALLIFAPGWKWTRRLIGPILLPFLLAVVYVVMVAATMFSELKGGFSSLDQVALLFENRHVLLAGWIHYLAFDLIVGCWEVRDARRLGIHHLLVVPCLVFTFLAGPVGFFLYVLLRVSVKRELLIGENGVQVVR